MENGSPKVKSLYKAIKLLDFFNAQHPERGVKELADLTGMLKSSVYNVMSTFQLCGIIEKSGASGKYRLGKKILELSNVLMNNDEDKQIIKPFMDELAEECGETIYLARPSGIEIIYIDSSTPKGRIFARLIVGVKAEMYCTGLGKAMLAFLGEDTFDRAVAAGLKPYTPNTITDEAALRRDMEETRRRGYAIDNMEHEYGIRCVAVPIRNSEGDVVAALSLSGPSLRVMDDKIPYFAERLLAASSQLQTLLKY